MINLTNYFDTEGNRCWTKAWFNDRQKGGPVPVHYDTIYDNIDGISKEIVISHNMESTRLSCEGFDASVFTEQEQQTLNAVLAMAQPMNTKELIDKSHEEEAWLNHREGNELIPYSEAFALH